MKFKVRYKVYSIPCDIGNDSRRIFDFTYEADISQLGDLSSHVNEYLQQYFAVGNYEILSMKKAEEAE